MKAPHLIQIPMKARARVDMARLRDALFQRVSANPTLSFDFDTNFDEFVVSGPNVQALDLMVAQLKMSISFEVEIGAPQVAYRETLTKAVTIDYTHKRQAHGVSEFARVKLQLVPLDINALCTFSTSSDLVMSAEFIDGVQKGFESVLLAGPYAGFPVLGLQATLLDAAWHDKDSSEKAFEIAGRAAVRQAASDGAAALLEPIMRVRISAPESYTEAIEADIRIRRGKILNRLLDAATAEIVAAIPLVMLFKHEDNMRSLTLGQCSVEMEFSHYALLPNDPPPPPAETMRAA